MAGVEGVVEANPEGWVVVAEAAAGAVAAGVVATKNAAVLYFYHARHCCLLKNDPLDRSEEKPRRSFFNKIYIIHSYLTVYILSKIAFFIYRPFRTFSAFWA
jgi:hypothetical protein